ncbi:MAG TPA: hypothetical protein VK454_04825 [Myxococcaceae bacterium]|nr:hypothetical protein [Myxococcaceae bacterium]
MLRILVAVGALGLAAACSNGNSNQYTCNVTCPDGSQHNNIAETASSADAACTQALATAGCPNPQVNYSCNCQNN